MASLHEIKLTNLKHILFVCSWYPNEENEMHGVFIKRHAEIISKNHLVTVVFAKSSEQISELTITFNQDNNLTEIILLYPKIKLRIPFISEYLKFINYNKVMLQAFKLAEQQQKIDIIHLQVIFPAAIPTLRLLKENKKPLIITEHWTGYATEDGSYNGLLKTYFTKKIIKKSQKIVVISNYLKKIMQFQGLLGEYHIVYNQINTNVFRPMQEIMLSNEVKYIHISSLDDKQKNVSGILNSFAKARSGNTCITLTIVGEGNDKIALQNLSKKLNIDDAVYFMGSQSESGLAKILNEHHALVMFSNYETFCLVAAEALSCGKPVITSAVGGLNDYMTNKVGILVEPKDEEQLKTAMLNFAKNRQQFSSADIRNYALSIFNEEKISKDFSNLYNQMTIN